MHKTILAKCRNPDAALILDEACAKFTAMPGLTLARYLVERHPGLWPNITACRLSIARRRGRQGNRNRVSAQGAMGAFPSTAPSSTENPWLLPKSEAAEWKPLHVTVAKETKALILSDLQIPYHDNAPIECALKRGVEEQCGIVIINGDFLDFYQLSRYCKDPRKITPARELERGNQMLDLIDRLFPKARKIFKLGNHDERFDHYMWTQAGMVSEMFHRFLEGDKGLKLDGRGWETVRDRQIIMLGRLPVLHGHEFPYTGDSVNPARTLFLKTIENGIMADRHRTSEHVETKMGGKVISCWSIGCLCGLNPYYMKINKWNHGFALVAVAPNGDYKVTNIRVYNGKAFN